MARPDPKWGETPCAIIKLKSGTEVAIEELIAFCCQYLAGFKVPKSYLYETLPKNSTGKIEKYKLRERLRSLENTFGKGPKL